jgi:hypothetical protein
MPRVGNVSSITPTLKINIARIGPGTVSQKTGTPSTVVRSGITRST